MESDQVDYTKYESAELEEAQRIIDKARFPERAAQIDLLLRDRRRRKDKFSQSSSTPQDSATTTTSTAKVVGIVVGVVAILGVLGFVTLWAIGIGLRNSDVAANLGKKLGDQNLKTVVALVELHKTRYGEYPQVLGELRFTGQWDLAFIEGVSYCSNADQTAYFVSVTERGVIAASPISTSDEFWQGTGFDPAVGPCE